MPASEAKQTRLAAKEKKALVGCVFIAGLCSIIYELLISTTSSYFLGDSIKQFSITIGFYMAAMGAGSFLSRYIRDESLLYKFVLMEIGLGLLGGLSVPLLYLVYSQWDFYQVASLGLTLAIGLLIGLEIPLLTRILQNSDTLRVNLSNVLSMDYLGALLATLIFPFVLLPFLGVFRSSIFFGLVNMMIGFLVLWAFAPQLNKSRRNILIGFNSVVITLLLATLASSEWLLGTWTNQLYEDRVILNQTTPYQKIVLTKDREDIRLFLNGNLQFSSIDEYRYHESLVHIPLSHHLQARVLILGGGDGMVAREALKYSDLKSITLVDLDPAVTQMAKTNYHLLKLNQNALSHPKVTVIHQDAFLYLKNSRQTYDVILADLPDPNNTSLSRLYSREFYKLIHKRLHPKGHFVTQATSPFFAKEAFWCTANTIMASGFAAVFPYHVNVPSFGEWGFVMASPDPAFIDPIAPLKVSTRFLEFETMKNMFYFEKDLRTPSQNINTLDRPILLGLYLDSWKYWN